jgi:hypothetical protein
MEQSYASEGNPLLPKCQCVTFEKSGRILGSCDSLFPVSGMSPDSSDRNFPFLKAVASELNKSRNEADPLFYPELDFSFSGYHSICDFTFMKTTDARGAERFVWIIYDNSTHYRLRIDHNKISATTEGIGKKYQNTSTAFLKAG